MTTWQSSWVASASQVGDSAGCSRRRNEALRSFVKLNQESAWRRRQGPCAAGSGVAHDTKSCTRAPLLAPDADMVSPGFGSGRFQRLLPRASGTPYAPLRRLPPRYPQPALATKLACGRGRPRASPRRPRNGRRCRAATPPPPCGPARTGPRAPRPGRRAPSAACTASRLRALPWPSGTSASTTRSASAISRRFSAWASSPIGAERRLDGHRQAQLAAGHLVGVERVQHTGADARSRGR